MRQRELGGPGGSLSVCLPCDRRREEVRVSIRGHTHRRSSVLSRSKTLDNTRSLGMPYGCSPWKGTAASFFVP